MTLSNILSLGFSYLKCLTFKRTYYNYRYNCCNDFLTLPRSFIRFSAGLFLTSPLLTAVGFRLFPVSFPCICAICSHVMYCDVLLFRPATITAAMITGKSGSLLTVCKLLKSGAAVAHGVEQSSLIRTWVV